MQNENQRSATCDVKSRDMADVVESCNRFAFALHSKLAEGPGNLFFSPSSISTALAMTLAGAAAETAEEMAEVLCSTLPENRFHEGFREMWTTLRTCLVDVAIPKFRVESGFWLNEPLESLGMRQAFSREEADFSRMSDDPEGLYIAAVIHKAFVDVNEKGTEAAAATAVVMAGCGVAEPEQPKVFRADHPFLFLIRDRETRLIHFIGRIVSPAAESA